MPVLNPKALIKDRVDAIAEYHKNAGVPKAQLDVSGGVDSAVMAGLLILALGPENVILSHTKINTNPEQTLRAKSLCKALGAELVVADFTEVYQKILKESLRAMEAAGYSPVEIHDRMVANPTIEGSIRSTLRAPLGRGFNRIFGGGIRHGTGNECEDRWLRFYQKGGDGEVDTNPIAMLSKGEVYQLAFELGKQFGPDAVVAFRSIIDATPSPDLWGTGDGHSDEDELKRWLGVPFTYSRIDSNTGEYSYVGTIEKVSRFLDGSVTGPDGVMTNFEDLLFESEGDDAVNLVLNYAIHTISLPDNLVEDLLMAARKVERITRHKFNPNCPTLGDRESLVKAGILTNNLPG